MNRHFPLSKITALISLTAISIGLFALTPITHAATARKKITVTSPAFKNGRKIPVKYVLPESLLPGAEGLSPPIKWKVAAVTARKIKSFALIMVDLKPSAKKWVHWQVINIGAKERALNEGGYSGNVAPTGAGVNLQNTFGFSAYGGPNPPKGTGLHTYDITVYGLNVEKLTVPEDAELSAAAFRKLLRRKIVAQGKLKGKFEWKLPAGTALVPDGEHMITAKAVEITTSGFSPSTLTIKVGETVQFVNKDSNLHWPASAVHPTHTAYPEAGGCIGSKFDACTGLKTGETFNFQLNQKGLWKYHDHLSPGLTGTIEVTE